MFRLWRSRSGRLLNLEARERRTAQLGAGCLLIAGALFEYIFVIVWMLENIDRSIRDLPGSRCTLVSMQWYRTTGRLRNMTEKERPPEKESLLTCQVVQWMPGKKFPPPKMKISAQQSKQQALAKTQSGV
ncbi:hypothetical protein BO99DRAFT_10833 [Aspergillus violaceofuscus CBS 115571]|uniref:Uncharacterized protein n=1 Tax=Aspergillus violaceofuscus (strain CBS 115571) TaxID=1450538 RepID=A0A2V5HFV7_ASPV1|nr:hypothetical protein BO99DRAFT_10833 [Aspergillus violaceofuscus CBS 115571]